MPTWPSSLPQRPTSQGYAGEDQDSVVRFKPTYGEPLARAGAVFPAGPPELFSVGYTLDAAQLVTLIAFYRSDCAHGSLEFTFPHPETGVAGTFMFVSPPQRGNISGVLWNTAFQVMKIP